MEKLSRFAVTAGTCALHNLCRLLVFASRSAEMLEPLRCLSLCSGVAGGSVKALCTGIRYPIIAVMKYFSPETRQRMATAQKLRATPEERKQRSLVRETKLPEATVRFLYSLNATQDEIAQFLGVSQKVVWRFMRNHGIPARRAVKRNQYGKHNSSWRGNKAAYTALHLRVAQARGKPQCCAFCGSTDESKTYEWANLSGRYTDVLDFARLCRSCHRKYDKGRREAAHA